MPLTDWTLQRINFYNFFYTIHFPSLDFKLRLSSWTRMNELRGRKIWNCSQSLNFDKISQLIWTILIKCQSRFKLLVKQISNNCFIVFFDQIKHSDVYFCDCDKIFKFNIFTPLATKRKIILIYQKIKNILLFWVFGRCRAKIALRSLRSSRGSGRVCRVIVCTAQTVSESLKNMFVFVAKYSCKSLHQRNKTWWTWRQKWLNLITWCFIKMLTAFLVGFSVSRTWYSTYSRRRSTLWASSRRKS